MVLPSAPTSFATVTGPVATARPEAEVRGPCSNLLTWASAISSSGVAPGDGVGEGRVDWRTAALVPATGPGDGASADGVRDGDGDGVPNGARTPGSAVVAVRFRSTITVVSTYAP